MADENRIAGTASIRVGSTVVTVGGSCTVSVGNIVREAVTGMGPEGGAAGYVERAKVPFVEFEHLTRGAEDLWALGEVTNATVIVDLANGKQAILREAWCTQMPDVDAAAGTAALRFEARSGQWR